MCPAGQKDMIFNPGINHLLQRDDECYYISENNEVYSDYQVVQPTCVQSGLWRTSATLGLLAMYLSGIDPSQMFHQTEEYEERESDDKRTFPRVVSFDKTSRRISQSSLEFNPHTDGDVIEPTSFRGTDACDGLEEELDEQLAVEVTNWQHDIQLGLQLLKYHGEGEQLKQKPCIKLCVKNSCTDQGNVPRSLSVPAPTTPTHVEGHTPPTLGVIPEDGPEVVVVGNEEEQLHHLKIDKHQRRVYSQPNNIFHLGLPKHHTESSVTLDHKRKSSSLKIHPPAPDTS